MNEMLHEGTSGVELPKNSFGPTCQFYLRQIERSGTSRDVESFLAEKLSRPAKDYASVEEFYADNPSYESGIEDGLSNTEKAAVKEYSGYKFSWINSVARGFWDYDKMGRKTPELEEEIKETTRQIIGAIQDAPAPEEDFITYRGTNLDAFRAYGINSVADLKKMQGQFMLEQGFTSTALLRENSFVNREVSDLWIGKSEVEMRFRIPAGSHQTIALFSDELSYSPQQTEVLIEDDTLSYISKVEMKDGKAIIEAILIPPEVYDPAERK